MQDIYYAVAHRSQEEIDSFKSRYEDFDDSLIPEIFRSALDLTVESWKPSESWGSSHVIYFVETKEQGRLILRANTGFNPEPEAVMLTEKLITDRVLEQGVPTNHVLHVDISRGTYPFDYQIQEVLQGKDPERDFTGTQEDYDQISYELGVNVAKYHQIQIEKFGRFDPQVTAQGKLSGTKNTFYDYITICLDSDLEYLVEAKIVAPKKATEIRKIFEEYKPVINVKRGVLVHHDLADHNIMFEGAHVTGIFDWEAAVVGDPILDLASCPTWKTLYPRKEKLLEGYTTVTNLPEHFEEKWNIYQLRTMLWKIVYAIRANILTPERTDLFRQILKPFK